MNTTLQLPSKADALARASMQTPAQRKVDLLQSAIAKLPQVELPLTHRFTPGLYIRQIFMPKGALVISKIHKTEHPFVCLKGHAAVWIEGVGVEHVRTGHVGITKPGTRRILWMHEDTVWVTFHPTDKTDLKEIEDDVIYDPKKDVVETLDAQAMKELAKPC